MFQLISELILSAMCGIMIFIFYENYNGVEREDIAEVLTKMITSVLILCPLRHVLISFAFLIFIQD